MRQQKKFTTGTEAESLRPLKLDELVLRGDLIDNGRNGLEPWDGPGGFRADSFAKQVFRKCARRLKGAENHFEHDEKLVPGRGPAH